MDSRPIIPNFLLCGPLPPLPLSCPSLPSRQDEFEEQIRQQKTRGWVPWSQKKHREGRPTILDVVEPFSESQEYRDREKHRRIRETLLARGRGAQTCLLICQVYYSPPSRLAALETSDNGNVHPLRLQSRRLELEDDRSREVSSSPSSKSPGEGVQPPFPLHVPSLLLSPVPCPTGRTWHISNASTLKRSPVLGLPSCPFHLPPAAEGLETNSRRHDIYM